MGNRANYIIRSNQALDYHYTHWRSIYIAKDLLLGPKKFLEFVKQFEKRDELLNEPLIEGCVLVDLSKKELVFWENEELFEFSVKRQYIELLSEIWTNWKVTFAEEEMYEIEKRIGIDYTINQKVDYKQIDPNELLNAKDEDYACCIVIIKEGNSTQLKKLYAGTDESIALLGEQLIHLILGVPTEPLMKESDLGIRDILFIDCDNKSITINQFYPTIKSELEKNWPGWEVNTGNYGYIGILEKSGIDTFGLLMKKEEVDLRINEIKEAEENFDPNEFAARFLERDSSIKFNPNFFENIKPKESFWGRISKFLLGK